MIDYVQHAMIPAEFISCVKLQISAPPPHDSMLDFFRIVNRQVRLKTAEHVGWVVMCEVGKIHQVHAN